MGVSLLSLAFAADTEQTGGMDWKGQVDTKIEGTLYILYKYIFVSKKLIQWLQLHTEPLLDMLTLKANEIENGKWFLVWWFNYLCSFIHLLKFILGARKN